MSFRTRLAALCGVLAGLLALLILGFLFSPDQVHARASGQPILQGVSALKVDGIVISMNGEIRVSLRHTADGWEARAGARAYPASRDRITAFLRIITGLPRTSLVSSDPRHLAELGLSADAARLLVLHQAGAPDVGLLVGKRGPSGDADYVQVRGQAPVYLARGSLAFFLAQDRSYWFELHVLPDDVQGTTIAAVTVSGSLALAGSSAAGESSAAGAAGALRGGYTLKRLSAEKQDQWVIGTPVRPADRVTAGAMANALALLEGVDFAESPGPTSGATGELDISVSTFEGKTYSITARPGPQPGKVLITTSWSPWTYLVNAVLLQRAVLPEGKLAAAR